jgi:dipeptidyl aminopeptidase/acylaminoacyl peptidase
MRLLDLAACSIVVMIIAAVTLTPSSEAAFPGKPGRIAFADLGSPSGISEMNADGTHVRRLTSGDDLNPSWNANGVVMLYENGGTVYGLEVLGGDNQVFTLRPGTNPSFATDLGTFVFSEDEDIWIGETVIGGTATNLTNTAGVTDLQPMVSPDGSMIAFSSNEDPGGDPMNPTAGTNFNLWLMDANGANRHILWENDAGTYEGAPDWSPDSQTIAFSDNGDIWITPTDGNNQTDITDDDAQQTYPAWSPDGKLIAYVETPDVAGPLDFGDPGTGGEIWTIDPDTRDRANLTNDADAHESMPDWEPIAAPGYIWGDTLCDGQADPTDALALLVYLSGADSPARTGCYNIGSEPFYVPTPTPSDTPQPTDTPVVPFGSINERTSWGNWDCQNDIDPQDVIAILSYVAGIPFINVEAPAGAQGFCTAVGEVEIVQIFGPVSD